MTLKAVKSNDPTRCKKCFYRNHESCLDIPCSTERRQFTGDVYFIDPYHLSKPQRELLTVFSTLTYRCILGKKVFDPTMDSLVKKGYLAEQGIRVFITDKGREALKNELR